MSTLCNKQSAQESNNAITLNRTPVHPNQNCFENSLNYGKIKIFRHKLNRFSIKAPTILEGKTVKARSTKTSGRSNNIVI